jgi:hypothetical protein
MLHLETSPSMEVAITSRYQKSDYFGASAYFGYRETNVRIDEVAYFSAIQVCCQYHSQTGSTTRFLAHNGSTKKEEQILNKHCL